MEKKKKKQEKEENIHYSRARHEYKQNIYAAKFQVLRREEERGGSAKKWMLKFKKLTKLQAISGELSNIPARIMKTYTGELLYKLKSYRARESNIIQ